MKKIFSILCVLSFLLFCAAAVAADEELDLEELIIEDEVDENNGLYESDGSRILTVTCTGDFTIGGDNYHKKDLFTKELKKTRRRYQFHHEKHPGYFPGGRPDPGEF